MKKLLIIFLALFSINVQSQKTKKVKNKISGSEKEIFHVLESDDVTKNGKYEYYKSKQLITSGTYNNGDRDGLWTEYIWDGSKRSEGYYKNDLKNGHWIYYGYKEFKIREGLYREDYRVGNWQLYIKGKLVQEFDFDNDKLIVIDDEIVNSNKVIFGGKYDGLIMVDKRASYIEGPEGLHKFLLNNIHYPAEVEKKGISGKVYVSALLNIDGSLSDFKVKKGLDPILDNQLIGVLKLTEGNWNLAEFQDEKVSTRVGISVVYGKI